MVMNTVFQGIRPKFTDYRFKDITATEDASWSGRNDMLWSLMDLCWRHIASERPTTSVVLSRVSFKGSSAIEIAYDIFSLKRFRTRLSRIWLKQATLRTATIRKYYFRLEC